MIRNNKFLRILHSSYCLALLFLCMTPGSYSQYSSLLENKTKSRALNNMGEYALLYTDFGLHILQYVSLLLILTIGFSILCSYSSFKASSYLNNIIRPRLVLIFFPLLSVMGLMVLHSKQFPLSAHTYSSLLEISIYHPLAIIGLAFVAFTLLSPIGKLINTCQRFPKITLICITLLCVPILIGNLNPKIADKNTDKNVIIISIDSLRLDLYKDHMPFLNTLLSNSSIVEHAYTPFARTFPSWSTILSGQYPPESGARYNLIDEKLLNKNTQYLPNILKKEGYTSIYASDERRFSHIGKHQGFDQVLGPRTGLSDFILGRYADQPLTNLVSLLPYSYIFLPELTINRAAKTIYTPEYFSDYLSNQLKSSVTGNQPLFLATHFCLAHWPFKSKNTSSIPHTSGVTPYYFESLSQVDKQIKRLWTDLEESNLLNNSIIVFLSDHGESWTEDLNFTRPDSTQFKFNTHGHGDNVINDNEHNVLTAIYNNAATQPIVTDKMSTLADITPTILDQLGLPIPIDLNGRSLLAKNKDKLNDFIFPVESGFTVTATASENINPEEAAQQAVGRYYVTKAGQLRIKINEIPFLNQGKRIGVRNKNYILTYQSPIFSKKNKLMLLNLEKMTGKEVLSTHDLKSSLELKLIKSMCYWYSEEITSLNLCSDNYVSNL